MFERLCNNLKCRLLLYMVPVLLLLGGMVYLAFHFIANDAVEKLAHSFAEDKVRFHKQQATGIIQQEINLSKLIYIVSARKRNKIGGDTLFPFSNSRVYWLLVGQSVVIA